MEKAEMYRRFAADCLRMAKSMRSADKTILEKMANAWELRAQEAERSEKKSDGKDGNGL